MDASKTGAFIAQLRKEKQYTQKELAQKLNVSDKAVSRWETGKGFPDTTLLQPLSDALGISISELLAGEYICGETIKDQVDDVIVASMEDSRKKLTAVTSLCIGLAVLVLICCLVIFLPMLTEPSAIEFVNRSQTSMLYFLADDEAGVRYDDFVRDEFSNGYEYYLPDGTERYVFSTVSGSSGPVLSYMHHSGEGMLFGFQIGDDTVIKSNNDLGIGSTSLLQYLENNGFSQAHDVSDFGRPTLVYVDGERCNWHAYTKENVFINICISAYEGRRLIAYDIGLIDASLNVVFEQMQAGFPITLDDPYHLVTSVLENAYPQWDRVTITAAGTKPGETLYLYINGQMIDKFTDSITFPMWGAPITVLITPESMEDETSLSSIRR